MEIWRKDGMRRLAYIAAGFSLLAVPAHFFVSCRISGTVWLFGCGATMASLLFCAFVEKGKQGGPALLAFAGFFGHMLCTH